MNKSQKLVTLCVGIAVLAMLLFPPFVIHGENGIQAHAGFKFIWQSHDGAAAYYELPTVNVAQLLTQWAGVLLAGACLWIYFKE